MGGFILQPPGQVRKDQGAVDGGTRHLIARHRGHEEGEPAPIEAPLTA